MKLEKYLLRTSQLFPPAHGNLTGTCIICGFQTSKGHKIDFSDNFTSWNLLQEGSCICEYCYTLCRNQDYRRKSWVASLEGIRFLRRSEILDTLLQPPEPPFATYITKSGKKQGFLNLVNRINYSRNRFYIAFEDSLLFINRSELAEMVEVARKARQLKFGKSELLGNIKVKHWEHRELCEQILKFAKNPVWEVVVFGVE